ncbi:Asp-tRNA(Asn)/Glu-tRNA(Gln) amidotransferase subunit GatA [Aminivibrio sp.]|uniref:Asp-tRNA(Asn)/Glu-tRNA(Gln) amidotransferase subunit GatA n=1 Tax=Aminivibrio sp. TaxID=1872489 RepID=UPI00345EAA12
MELFALSAAEMVRGIKAKDFSASEVFASCLSRIEALEPELSALLALTAGRGREEAARIDGMIARGTDPGPLAGVPVVLKDNMCLRGVPATCASRILEGWIPPYDGKVAELLAGAGAVFAGKTNMDEFAMGSSTEFSAFHPTSNPWDTGRVPGGSSGGSAAAVAAGYAPLALGSDTGGSIRQPASYCGLYGLKPTYGLVSRWGLVAFASSLDQIGPFARTVEDLALLLSVIAAPDARDGTCSPRERPDYAAPLAAASLRGKRIAVVKELDAMRSSVDPEVRLVLENTLNLCRKEGAEIVEVSLPVSLEFGLPCYYILAPAEASSNLARFDGVRYGLSCREDSLLDLYLTTRGTGFGAEVKRRILTGTYVLSSGYYDAYYLTAQKVRSLMKAEFRKAFGRCDLIALPTAPTPAFKKGELVDDPVRMYLADVFTLPVNLAELPALSLNGGFTGGKKPLPVGVQFIAPQWGEPELLNAAAVLERRLGKAPIAPLGAATEGGNAP